MVWKADMGHNMEKIMVKKNILILILICAGLYAQTSPPSGYTPHYKFRMWSQGARPSADSLNQNWKDIDSVIYSVSQSVTIDTTDIAYKSKVNVFTDENTFNGKLNTSYLINADKIVNLITYYEAPSGTITGLPINTPTIAFVPAGYDSIMLVGIQNFYEGQEIKIINLSDVNLRIRHNGTTPFYKIRSYTREDIVVPPLGGSVILTGIDYSGEKYYLITGRNF